MLEPPNMSSHECKLRYITMKDSDLCHSLWSGMLIDVDFLLIVLLFDMVVAW